MSVKDKCVICRKLSKHTENQCMGQVFSKRLKPAPPFYHTAVDLFGPFAIKDTVKRKTHGKGYGVIFNCLVTRTVHLDLTEGYSAHDFLTTYCGRSIRYEVRQTRSNTNITLYL